MNSSTAFCPSCRTVSYFETTGGLRRCSVCGFETGVQGHAQGRSVLTPLQSCLFVVWLVLPSVLFLTAGEIGLVTTIDHVFGPGSAIWVGLTVTALNSFLACYWFGTRLYAHTASRIFFGVLVGIFLGLGFVTVNMVIVFFVGCASLFRSFG